MPSLSRSTRRGLSAVGLAAALGCASELDVHTLTAPNAQLDHYRTYAFDPSLSAPRAYATSPQSAEVQSRIEQMASTVLDGRGYAHATDHPDLVLRVKTGRRVTSAGEPIAPGPPDITEIPYDSTPLDDEPHDLVEGSFVIDAFDAKSHRMLWQGAVKEVIDPAHVDFDRLNKAVQKVLASFPVHPAS